MSSASAAAATSGVGELSAALASLGQQALDPQLSSHVRGGRIDCVECVQRVDQPVPLLFGARRVAAALLLRADGAARRGRDRRHGECRRVFRA